MTTAGTMSEKPKKKAKRTAQAKKTTRTRQPKKTAAAISDEQRKQMIQDAAYFRALNRGFSGGTPEQDWIEAEQEISARLEASV